ncbi:hypothetical protein Sme01_50350 [Sphaerisporangium melleum]|uniref:Uncharacterized protein n=1 Tax=Sphaerisporangium melleum TaxID=321316 RepID=A0A917VK72_9ACTN|nr:hypothetical protein [Sphaerisporangium melleum]GGK89935.1 hypothetical protein GCM10007964_35760 [Sphaerisporangium melleum]GII72559.1 hypothetical protein Sme01_50350 [Sphaerisporangium melleum]
MMALIGAAYTLLAVLVLMGVALVLIAVLGLIALAVLASTTSPEPELGVDGRPVPREAADGLARAPGDGSTTSAAETAAPGTAVTSSAPAPEGKKDAGAGAAKRRTAPDPEPASDRAPGPGPESGAAPETDGGGRGPGTPGPEPWTRDLLRESLKGYAGRVHLWPSGRPRSGRVAGGIAYARDMWSRPLRRYGETAQKLIAAKPPRN